MRPALFLISGCLLLPSLATEVPKGLAPSDWTSIRAAYEAGRHAIHAVGDGWQARNPGQQWTTRFDRRGFLATPRGGGWTWGLELQSYGFGNQQNPIQGLASASVDGQRLTYRWDENIEEWFINDQRGLEHGFIVSKRPHGAEENSPLSFLIATRGNLWPVINPDARGVSFQNADGATALNYSGLKVWDADGNILAARFEAAGESSIRLLVEEQNARYPITIDPVAQQAYLKASDPDTGKNFGAAVAISGDTVAVGAPANWASSGAVYIYQRTGNTWSEQARITSPYGTEYFGGSVGLFGGTMVVGHGGASSGLSASTYAFVFVRQNSTWTLQAALEPAGIVGGTLSDGVGYSVAISGDTIVLGAPGEDSNATGINGNRSNDSLDGAGAAYVFTRSGTVWSEQAYLKASNTGAGDSFGWSVSISGNTLIVGAHAEDSDSKSINGNQSNDNGFNSGAAYVFVRSGTTWTQQAYLKASNSGTEDLFGLSVAISMDTAVIGAWREDSNASTVNGNMLDNSAENSGAAYVFVRSGTTWTQQAYLKASNSEAQDYFGWSVSVDGDTICVGAGNEFGGEDGGGAGPGSNQSDNSASGAGAAYVFTRSGGTWSQQSYLKASNPESNDYFGESVCVSGSTVVAGAYGEDSGSGGVNGNQSDNSKTDAGAAYVFDLNTVIGAPEIVIEQSALGIPNGASKSFGNVPPGGVSDLTFSLLNTGDGELTLTGIPKVVVTDSADFTVTNQPASPVPPGGSTTFTVRFAPTAAGIKTASLSIPSDDTDESPFIIHLTGTSFSYSTDTDGDGMSDASEYNLAALGFDWSVAQPDLVNTYFENASGAGLFTTSQVQAMNSGTPLIAKDPATGNFKLTLDWKKSTDLSSFSDFPAPAGSSVTITPEGDVEFEFTAPDDAAFFRIEME